MEHARFRRFASWDRQEIEEQRHRLRTVPIEERLRETIAWSAALLADELKRARERGRTAVASPDPVGLGTRRT